MRKVSFVLLLLALTTSACSTTIGKHNLEEYGKHDWQFDRPRVVNVHVYLDRGVSETRARELMVQWREHEAKLYGLEINAYGFQELPRDFGFFHTSIMDQVAAIPLKDKDDRVFYFAAHGPQDFFYSYATLLAFIPPEVLGEVEDQTMTHGWAWAHIESIPSMLLPPADATTHEFYHLIGACPHGDDMGKSGCYDRIFALKQAPSEDGFFAAMSLSGHIYHSRAEVNSALAGWHDPLNPFASGERPPTPEIAKADARSR
jgi:hypothetical protein